MIKKLVIIFALIYAFHGVVDASDIISDDGKVHVVPRPHGLRDSLSTVPPDKQPCIHGWYDGMPTPCAQTGKLQKY